MVGIKCLKTHLKSFRDHRWDLFQSISGLRTAPKPYFGILNNSPHYFWWIILFNILDSIEWIFRILFWIESCSGRLQWKNEFSKKIPQGHLRLLTTRAHAVLIFKTCCQKMQAWVSNGYKCISKWWMKSTLFCLVKLCTFWSPANLKFEFWLSPFNTKFLQIWADYADKFAM